jgi:hypothetical protein
MTALLGRSPLPPALLLIAEGMLEDRTADIPAPLLLLDSCLGRPVLKPMRGIAAGGRAPPACGACKWDTLADALPTWFANRDIRMLC